MIQIYNSLTKKKEPLVPIEANKIKMYACGITPYDYCHIGHGMQAVIFDTIRRYLKYSGYDVTYVRNYTDVDDKIINKAKIENKSASEISSFYINSSTDDLKNLRVKNADFEPKVTDHIKEIIEFIEGLISKGNAYESKGSVYFSVDKFKNYGKLSCKNLDDLINAEGDSSDKSNPLDFALWKAYKEGEPYWASPWGNGRPGWHIECSCLAKTFLGETIDIHGGGIDIIFPHHENEVAQSEALSGKTFAKVWFHNGLVMVGKQKMSKSLNNGILLKDAIKDYGADVLRYMIFSFSFNSNINFEKSNLLNAEKRIYYFYSTLLTINKLLEKNSEALINSELEQISENFKNNFSKNMDDNFNTAKVLADLNDYFTKINEFIKKSKFNNDNLKNILLSLNPVFEIFDLLNIDTAYYFDTYKQRIYSREKIDQAELEKLIVQRINAKKQKDFTLADAIRKKLMESSIILKDTDAETTDWYFSKS